MTARKFTHKTLPRSRLVRITLGILFIIGGLFGWLPILGFWMIPLGLLFLSIDFAIARRWRRRLIVWWERRKGRPKGMAKHLPTFGDVRKAAARLEGVAVRTPLVSFRELDRRTGGAILVKPENLQPVGAFKLRGAYSRLSLLGPEERKRGVVAFSSGNHGQGVAYAAKLLGVSAVIVMPKTAPGVKIERTRAHGAGIRLFDPKKERREEIAAQIARETGRVLVPSYDDRFVIAGQGTSALEVIEDADARGARLDAYLVPAGGGGLLAGSSLAFAVLSPETKLYSVEPAHYDDHARSFRAGRRTAREANPPPTICDALLPEIPGELTFAINARFAAGGLVVSEAEVKQAMKFALEHMKMVVEPGGAVALAAVLSGKIETEGKTVGVIISGGNVAAEDFAKFIKTR